MNPYYPLSRLTFALMFCLAGAAQSAAPSAPPPQLVPLPMEMTCGLGSFEITGRVVFLTASGKHSILCETTGE